MVEKRQFTLKWLLVEVTLLGVVLSVLRRIVLADYKQDSDLQILLMYLLGIPCAVACAGAAVGRVFCDLKWSAAWTLALLLLFLFIAVLISSV